VFVLGCSILDNAIISIKVVHCVKYKIDAKEDNGALTLDISKAYDRIDWLYLKEVMMNKVFCQQWMNSIMMFVETMDYSFFVNNEIIGQIIWV
jgi:hypothetical protein